MKKPAADQLEIEFKIKHSLFQRANGRWVLTIAVGDTWKGARQIQAPPDVKGGTTERPSPAAKRWRDRRLAEIAANGGRVPETFAGTPSLRDVHERLMRVRAGLPEMKESTLQNNWTHLRAQILKDATIADLPMSRVGVPESRNFVRALRTRVSDNHTRNIFSTCRMLWDAAQAEAIITTPNPWRNALVVAEVPPAPVEMDPITIPLAAVQAHADANDEAVPLERRVRVIVAVLSGTDDGELAGLTWGHVHLRELGPGLKAETVPYFQVRQALAVRGRSGFATKETPKTANRLRDIPLHPAAELALVEWLEGWERLVCRKPRATDFVFPKANGDGARPPSARLLRDDLRVVNAAAVAAGRPPLVTEARLEAITFKSTRRTFSSALKAQNVDEEDRGQLMGHSGRTVTARNYTAHELERLHELISRIPLVWRSVEIRVVTRSEPSHGVPRQLPETVEMKEESQEARIGFEPTYDGFAILHGPEDAEAKSAETTENHRAKPRPRLGESGSGQSSSVIPAHGPHGSVELAAEASAGEAEGKGEAIAGPGVSRVRLGTEAIAPLAGGLVVGGRRP